MKYNDKHLFFSIDLDEISTICVKNTGKPESINPEDSLENLNVLQPVTKISTDSPG